MLRNLIKFLFILPFLFGSIVKAQSPLSFDANQDRRESLQSLYLYEKVNKISINSKWAVLIESLSNECSSDTCKQNVITFIKIAKKKETLKQLVFNFDPKSNLSYIDRKEILDNIEILAFKLSKLPLTKQAPQFTNLFMSAQSVEEYKSLFKEYILYKSEKIPLIQLPIDSDSGSSDGNKPKVDEQDKV